MSHLPTRKTFLGRLLAVLAIGGSAPKLLAESAAEGSGLTPREPAVPVQPERRAVARRADSV